MAEPVQPPRPAMFSLTDTRDAEEVSVRGLVFTGLLLAALVATSWILLTVPTVLTEQWIVGATVTLTGIVAFFGLYASVRKMRVALAGALFVAWLLLNTYAFVIGPLDDRKEFWDTLRQFMTVAVAFYFGSETIVQATKVFQAGKITSETIRRTGMAPDPAGVRAALNVDAERARRKG
uniref:hypothetical protein n=1 Tax=Herbidospora sakaeratensis TaxID=564415 RepID=UPI0007802BA2|nr:hypothetical protein [Herbidospora sakaeratensis]